MTPFPNVSPWFEAPAAAPDSSRPLRNGGGRHAAWRAALGGAICAGLGGIFCGTAVGALYGSLQDDLSLGLDGALLGGLLSAVPGAVYGALGAWRGTAATSPPPGPNAPDEGGRLPWTQ
jgi:hypothetical protein